MAFEPWTNSNQFFNDDGSESTATAIDIPETSLYLDTNTIYHLRLQVSDIGATAGTLAGAKWVCQNYTQTSAIIPVTATSQYIRAVSSAYLVHGEDTTQRIGALSFITPNGWVSTLGGLVPDLAFLASQQCEALLSFEVVGTDVALNDNIGLSIDVASNGTPGDMFVANIVTPPVTTRRVLVRR